MRLRLRTVSAAVIAALVPAVFGFAPAASATNQTPCNGHTDFVQLWTEYHGYPVCYANAGSIDYGTNPPYTTWSTSDICSGANQVVYDFYVWQNGGWHLRTGYLDYWECRHLRLQYGEVEMSGFDVLGR
jgi:hypothetical protein